MKKYQLEWKRVPLVLALCLSMILLAAGLAGCQHQFEKGGAYAGKPAVTNTVDGVAVVTPGTEPDQALYVIDSTFNFLYSSVDGVLKLERDNRKLFESISPSIKHTLDGLRPDISTALLEFAKARNAYKANPTPSNLSLLDQILSRLKAIGATAQAVIPDVQAMVAAKAAPPK